MTEQEKIWFEQLCSRNEGIWKTLCLPEVRGLLDSTIYKYNDTAHFIYELLQNADDAEASEVEFVLKRDRLILRHNGRIRFTVSNPENIIEDKAKGSLGHVNAITYFNFSGKEDDVRREIKQNKIGKFGIGFKSVYRYTRSPHIYDDNISFKIENMMIPSILEDTSLLEPGKTVFEIQFNSGHLTAEEAYKEIETKLKSLYQPQLFLQHIQRIRWSIGTEFGDLQQHVVVEDDVNDCHVEQLSISNGRGQMSSVLKLSRAVNIPSKGKYNISIAYYLDKNGRIDITEKPNIRCFFPISEHIQTCFALHAPFMLTENRQNLLPNNDTNRCLLQELAKFSAESLLVLRDFGIKKERILLDDRIKDISKVDFSNLSNWESFTDYKEDFFWGAYRNVLGTENVFLSSSNEYLKATETIWADEDIRALISPSQLQQLTGRKDYCLCSCANYLTSVKGLGGIEKFDNDKLNNVLTIEFLSQQKDAWLDKFYQYIHDNHLAEPKIDAKTVGIFREKPIFKNEAGNFVPAFICDVQKIFQYTEGVTTPEATVNRELYRQSAGLRQLIETLGIRQADRFNYIQLRLEDKSMEWTAGVANDFCTFAINYRKEQNEEQQKALKALLRDKWMLKCNKLFNKATNWYGPAPILYWDSQLIRDYFEISGNAHGAYLRSKTYGFVKAQQLVDEIREQAIFDSSYYSVAKNNVGEERFNEFFEWLGVNHFPRIVSDDKKGRIIDNITRVLNFLPHLYPEKQKKASHMLWDILCYYVSRESFEKLSYKYAGIPQYDRKSLDQILRSLPWLFIEGSLRRVSDRVYLENLATEEYRGDGSDQLISLLEITKRPSLSDAVSTPPTEEYTEIDFKESLRNYLGGKNIDDDTLQKITTLFENRGKISNEETPTGEIEEKSIAELTLEERAKRTEKYTYQWMRLLMEAEAIASNKDSESKKNKAVKIDFRNVIFQSEDIIKLEDTSRYIPHSLEEVDKIDVKFFYQADNPKTISFDAASVKDNALLLKVKNKQKAKIDELRKVRITHATVNVEHPIDLANSWKKLIDSLSYKGFTPTFSFQREIRSDLHFIFGPPGSGKTFRLADEIIAKIRQEGAKRVLVLAPTNKACDVITKKVIERTQGDCLWLYRFVKTMEDDLEEYVLFHDTPIGTEQACLVSTIARYAYDNCSKEQLTDMEWDYVIIDEASMIPLYQIIAPLFNGKCKNIIIAGDPFQIQPIVKCKEWKNRNIYTMLGIKDFEKPQSRFVDAQNIIPLKIQYRSIPEIGRLFGQYSYNGVLQHKRTSADRKDLNFGFAAQPLNLITFPCTCTQETKFMPIKLKGSNIHIYSIISVVELLRFITRHIATMSLDRIVNIGVVGPYVAEIKAIEKMQEQLVGYHDKVNIVCGSAHGFQGDECDVVIAVMNPPAGGLKKCPEKTFINNQNVLNVSISRAKDYLFVVMPSSDFELKDKLTEPNKIEEIMRNIGCQQYSSSELEQIIFKNPKEIEENTFVTSHQLANVYTDFSKKYEIRIDDNAIDIQVN